MRSRRLSSVWYRPKRLSDSKQAELDAVRSAAAEVAVDPRGCLESICTRVLTTTYTEQLCWSTLRVTGVLDAYIRIEAAELEKKSALPPDADAATRAARIVKRYEVRTTNCGAMQTSLYRYMRRAPTKQKMTSLLRPTKPFIPPTLGRSMRGLGLAMIM